jgi:hypothetical protein
MLVPSPPLADSLLLAGRPKFRPVLDPGFVPASLWNRAFRAKAVESGQPGTLAVALERKDGSTSVFRTPVLEGDPQ